MSLPDLIAVGRVDALIAEPESGVMAMNGRAARVAAITAEMGYEALLVSKVADDEVGALALIALDESGVDCTWVGLTEFTEPNSDPKFVLMDLPLEEIVEVPILWLNASSLAQHPSRSTMRVMLESRDQLPHTILDLSFDANIWDNEEQAREIVVPQISQSTIVIADAQDCEVFLETDNPLTAAEAMIADGAQLVVVAMGDDGVLAVDAEGYEATVPNNPRSQPTREQLSAAVAHGLLSGWSPPEILDYACSAGSSFG